jgi:hypothetical protein
MYCNYLKFIAFLRILIKLCFFINRTDRIKSIVTIIFEDWLEIIIITNYVNIYYNKIKFELKLLYKKNNKTLF